MVFGDTQLLDVIFYWDSNTYENIEWTGTERGIDDESEAHGVKAYQNSG